MKLRSPLLLVAIGIASLGAGPLARAFVATGPDDELFVTGTASAEYNDNLFLSHSNAKSDEIFDLVPGLDWEFGKNAVNKGSISVGDDVQIFASDSNLNTNLPSASFVDAFDDSKTKLNFDGNYQRLDQATRDVHLVGTLINRNWYHLDGTGEEALTDKTSVSLGAIYDNTDYLKAGFENWEWVQIPAKYYYRIDPKLDVSAGFTYQNNVVGAPGVDSSQYFYNVGLRGEILPKLSGELSVGYQEIEFKKGGSTGGLGAISNFSYAYSPKTTFSFSVNNTYGYSPVGGTAYKDFGVTGGVTSAISDQWRVGGQLSYNDFNYITSTEKDNFYAGQLSLTYVYNAWVSMVGTYAYSQDASNLASISYTDNTLTLALKVKY